MANDPSVDNMVELKVGDGAKSARKYRQCKSYIRGYERAEAQKAWEDLPAWQKADKLITKAASIRGRCKDIDYRQQEVCQGVAALCVL